KRYMEVGESPTDVILGTEANESGAGRSQFDDTEYYHQLAALPAQGAYGEELGTGADVGGMRHVDFRIRSDFFDNFRQRVKLYYVDPSNPSQPLANGQTSYYRGGEVA